MRPNEIQNPVIGDALRKWAGIHGQPAVVSELATDVQPVVIVDDLARNRGSGGVPTVRPCQARANISPLGYAIIAFKNPFNSGVLARLKAITLCSTAALASDVYIALDDGPVTTFTAFTDDQKDFRDGRIAVGSPACDILVFDAGGAPTTTFATYQLRLQSGNPLTFRFDPNICFTPATLGRISRMTLAMTTNIVPLTASFDWEEEPLAG